MTAYRDAMKATAARILVLDIETSPTLTYTFDMRPNWISPEKIVEPSRMLCWGAKWIGGKQVLFKSEYHHGREAMVSGLWELLDRTDILITYNGIKFDVPHIEREFLMADLNPTSSWQNVDLYRVGKRFSLESHSLQHLAERLEVGSKVKHQGFAMWRDCLAGKKQAWDDIRTYQKGDITVTENVYHRMRGRGWIKNHPHLGLYSGEERSCYQCGSGDLIATGETAKTPRTAYATFKCQVCGAISRNNHRRTVVTMVPAR